MKVLALLKRTGKGPCLVKMIKNCLGHVKYEMLISYPCGLVSRQLRGEASD